MEEKVVGRPEELINRYVRLMTATANLASGLGTLALLWSTAVVLGGFITELQTRAFWVVTAFSFLMASRVVDNYDNEYKRGIYWEEPKLMAFIRRQKWMPLTTARAQMTVLFMVLLPKSILLMCFSLLSVLPYVSLGISVWRLVRRDYGQVGGDVASTAKLNAALDIFYALVLLQTLLVLYWAALDVMLDSAVAQLELLMSKQCGHEKWSPEVVDLYRLETRRKFRKDGVLPGNWNLIAYGVELLQSASGADDHRWGARILDKLSDKDKSVREELLSSRLSIQNLMGMIVGRRGAVDDNIENRERAARIVAHLATDIHITRFPGTLQCIGSLLGSRYEPQVPYSPSAANHDEQTLAVAVPITTDQTDEEQGVVISSPSAHKRYKKVHQSPKKFGQKVRKYSERKYRCSYKPMGAKELISQGLLILERLSQDEGNCTEIIKHPWLLSKITSPLSRQDLLSSTVRGNRMVEMLSRSLTVVSRLLTSPGDGAARLRRDLASNMEAVSNLMGILVTCSQGAQELREQVLDILTELAFDDSFKIQDFNKLFKALLRIFLEEEADNTAVEEATNATAQMEQADTEKATRLRGKAGEALARLLPLRTARDILSEQKAINVLTKVLSEIVSSKMGTNADAATGAGGSNSVPVDIVAGSQPLEEPPAQENEKPSEERKFMAAMLSLAVVMCNKNVISEEDFARTIHEDTLAKKLKEILGANKHRTAEHLRIVKLTCQVAITMIQVRPSCVAHFNEHGFKEALAEALETMSEVDDCMLFAGNDRGVMKPARSSLVSLVKEAQELLKIEQQQGNGCL